MDNTYVYIITLALIVLGVHPRNFTWNPKMMVSKTSSRVLFSGSMLDFGGVNHWDLYLFFWALFAKPRLLKNPTKGASFQALAPPREALDREHTLGNGAPGFTC